MATHPHDHATPAEPDWVHGHPHEPNPAPPSPDATFVVHLLNDPTSATPQRWRVADLEQLPYVTITNCYIVSTGHGTSGPFTFGGVRLRTFLDHLGLTAWQTVDVIGGDGFGTRLTRQAVETDPPQHPSLLAYTRNDIPLRREEGLVRLIVPTETDDALKQVKWVAEMVVR